MIGEAMMVGCIKTGGKWRGVVVVAEMVPPPHPLETRTLFESPRCEKRAAALDLAMAEMFVLYQQRYGFKHPDDPARTSFDAEPSATVITLAA